MAPCYNAAIERFGDNCGVRLWTWSEGSGPPLILCNGGPGCCDYMAPVSQLLCPYFRVIRFEERGCGRSDFTPPYTYEHTIPDMEAIRTAYGVDRWIVGGHSAGVNLALAYTMEHPSRVQAVFGISGGRFVNDREWSRIYHERRASEGEALPDFAYPSDPEVNRQGNAWWNKYITQPQLLRRLAEFPAPVHFINAGRDIRPNWPTQQLAHLIPHGSYEEIAGAGHAIWLTHAQELANRLLRFLHRIGWSGDSTT